MSGEAMTVWDVLVLAIVLSPLIVALYLTLRD